MISAGSWKSDILCLGILAGLCLPIGIHQVRKLALINPDGVLYIDLGHQLPGDYVGVARRYPPGYPLMLWAGHAAATRVVGHDTPMLWLYSALGVTLLCRMLALIPLYFLGKLLVGAANSFWALLILILLPYPAQYAAEVLREWPYVLFLATGFWLLCWALRRRHWWALALVGLDTGLGYLIRPECGQLIFYTLLGVIVQCRPSARRTGLEDGSNGIMESWDNGKTSCALPSIPSFQHSIIPILSACLLAVAGFLVPVAPHVRAVGSITPHQLRAPAAQGPPTISAVGPRAASDDPLEFEVPEGELLELPVRASDALGAPLTFSLAAVPVGSRPVYGFRSPATGSRVWTVNEDEKYSLLVNYARAVWEWEGIACYAYAHAGARVGLRGVWRLWSPTRARHFYTIDEQEKETLLQGSGQDTWLSDGVVFYGWPPGRQPPEAVPVYRFGNRESEYSWAVQGSPAYQAVPADEARTGTVAWYVHQGDAPPAGATIRGGVFRWRPGHGQRGDYQITIIGSDGQLESCQSVIIRVTAAPSARAVRPPAQQAGIGSLPGAAYKILSGVAQDLMVVFFVPWLLGLFRRLRYQAERTELVLITAVLLINTGLILMRRLSLGPGDERRYALGLISLTIFYVPIGIEVLAQWLNSLRPWPRPHWLRHRLPRLSWFHLLVAVGLAACLPKLLFASPGTKVGYRAAAAWLQQNTGAGDVLAVPDVRISFYAQRRGLLYLQHPNSRRADYVIMIEDGTTHPVPEEWRREYSVMVDRRTRKTLVIYRTAPPALKSPGQGSS